MWITNHDNDFHRYNYSSTVFENWDSKFLRRQLWRLQPGDVLYSFIEVDWLFRGAYCSHHQDDHRSNDGGSKHLSETLKFQ
jgi:hypothetical protein